MPLDVLVLVDVKKFTGCGGGRPSACGDGSGQGVKDEKDYWR